MNLPLIWPPAGRYVLAVSGGADSIVLLDCLARAAAGRGYELTVAHFDHGLREDSAASRRLVAAAARQRGLPFVYHEAALGRASEAVARAARYDWLETVRRQHGADAIITGHHRDDLVETSLLNLTRGSGRRGLAPMQSASVLRPMLRLSRRRLREYALAHELGWHEDSTNNDLSNPRNYLRRRLLAAASDGWTEDYLRLIDELARLNAEVDRYLDRLLEPYCRENAYELPRSLVRDLSLEELAEVLVAAARRLQPEVELDRRVVQEMALFAKTARPGRRRPLRQRLILSVDKGNIRIQAVR